MLANKLDNNYRSNPMKLNSKKLILRFLLDKISTITKTMRNYYHYNKRLNRLISIITGNNTLVIVNNIGAITVYKE